MQRGVVLPLSFTTPFDYPIERAIEVMHLNTRKALLFWDKIDAPSSRAIISGGGEDIGFLVDAGFAKRTIVTDNLPTSNGESIPFDQLWAATQLEAYRLNNQIEGESWSIMQPLQGLVVPEAIANEMPCIEFELYNAISIPTGDVAIQDVLEFKMRRQAELDALREAMDGIVADIAATSSIPNRKSLIIQNLNRTLDDFNRVMTETGFQRVKRSLKSILTGSVYGLATEGASKIKDFFPEYLSGQMESLIDLNLPSLGVAAAVFTYRELKVGREIPSEFQPFAYVESMRREFG